MRTFRAFVRQAFPHVVVTIATVSFEDLTGRVTTFAEFRGIRNAWEMECCKVAARHFHYTPRFPEEG